MHGLGRDLHRPADFGALVPWPAVHAALAARPRAKLVFFVRHAHAHSNLAKQLGFRTGEEVQRKELMCRCGPAPDSRPTVPGGGGGTADPVPDRESPSPSLTFPMAENERDQIGQPFGT